MTSLMNTDLLTSLLGLCLRLQSGDANTEEKVQRRELRDPKAGADPRPMAVPDFPRMPSALPLPLEKVFRVALEISQRPDPRQHAALFESLRPRVLHEIGAARSVAELEPLGAFVALFYQLDFLAQTRYFDRLEALHRLFQQRARAFGVFVEEVGRGAARLEASEPATAPDRWPLPIQRHLARSGASLELFACHDNNLIAREVVQHVSVDNLAVFLELPKLNRQFFEDTLRALDLRERRDLWLSILTHVRCPPSFAASYLPRCDADALHQVIQSVSTHSEIRRKAMLLTIERRGGANP